MTKNHKTFNLPAVLLLEKSIMLIKTFTNELTAQLVTLKKALLDQHLNLEEVSCITDDILYWVAICDLLLNSEDFSDLLSQLFRPFITEIMTKSTEEQTSGPLIAFLIEFCSIVVRSYVLDPNAQEKLIEEIVRPCTVN